MRPRDIKTDQRHALLFTGGPAGLVRVLGLKRLINPDHTAFFPRGGRPRGGTSGPLSFMVYCDGAEYAGGLRRVMVFE